MPYPALVDEPVSPDRELDQGLDHGLDHGLDQRQAERRQVSLPASVTLVGAQSQVLHGTIRNLSEGGTQILLDEPLPSSTLVKIEYEDSLLLGEVVYCQPEQSAWLVGIKIEHGLFELTALAAALQGF
jgi:hypothetical protein